VCIPLCTIHGKNGNGKQGNWKKGNGKMSTEIGLLENWATGKFRNKNERVKKDNKNNVRNNGNGNNLGRICRTRIVFASYLWPQLKSRNDSSRRMRRKAECLMSVSHSGLDALQRAWVIAVLRCIVSKIPFTIRDESFYGMTHKGIVQFVLSGRVSLSAWCLSLVLITTLKMAQPISK